MPPLSSPNPKPKPNPNPNPDPSPNLGPRPAHAVAPALVAGQQAERSDPTHGERGLHRAEAGDHDQRRAQPHRLGRHDAVARVQLREHLVRYLG